MNRPGLRYLATIAGIAIVYFGAAKLGLSLALSPKQVTPVWPPTGIAFVAYVVFGYRVWPGVWLGAFLANSTMGEHVATAGCISVGNTVAGIAGLALLRRFGGFDRSLERVRGVLGLVFCAGAIGAAISATNGVINLAVAGIVSWSAWGSVWWLWWLGDAMGVLLVAPFLLTWLVKRPEHRERVRWVELAVLCVLVAAVCSVAFSSHFAASGEPVRVEYALFPFIIWAALRFGQREAASLVMVISSVAIWTAVHQHGPFGSGALEERLLLLQLFTAVTAFTALTLGAVVAERKRAEEALREDHDQLEARVKERTTLFQMIADYGSDMLARADANGVIRAVSPACRKILGYEPEELIGTRTVDLFLSGDRLKDTSMASVVRARRKDGRYVWLESNTYAVKDPATHEVLESIGLTRDITERIAFMEKLGDEQRRLAAAEQIAHLGAWEWDVVTDRVVFSEELGRIFGADVTPFEPSLDGFVARVHPEDCQRVRDVVGAALQAAQPWILTIRIVKPGGEVRVLHVKGEIFVEDSGAVRRMMGTCQDITEQRQAEAAWLRQTALNESLLRAQNEIGEGVAVTEGARIVYANDALAKIYGYSVEELYAMPSYFDLIAPEERSVIAGRLRLRESGQAGVENNETVIIRKDGSRVDIQYAVKPIRVAAPAQLFTIVRDITEQKQSADARRWLADIVESSDDAIVGVALDGSVWSWNRGAERLYGYRAVEMLGRSLEVIFPPDRMHEQREHLDRIRRGESVAPFETVRRRKDGQDINVAVTISAIRNARGDLIGFSKVTRDIAHEKLAQQMIETSLREKEVLLKEIHHRVKNNLQIISSLLNLQSRHIDAPVAKALFLESDSRVKSIALVHEKLYQAENLASIEFEGYLRSLAIGLSHSFGTKHHVDVSAPRLLLPIDAAIPCGLIVNELVSNSLKYAFPDDGPGHISVSLRVDDGRLVLEVADDGVGLPKELDFRNATSMGLQLVCSLAKQLRGELELLPGAGTHFRVRFKAGG